MESRFDTRIDNLSRCGLGGKWIGAIVEVVDTSDAIRLALEDWGMKDPALLLGLTQLAIERYNARSAESPEHGRNNADA